MNCGHRIGDAVSTHIPWIVVQNGKAGADPGGHNQRVDAEEGPANFLKNQGQRWHHAAQASGGDLVCCRTLELQQIGEGGSVLVNQTARVGSHSQRGDQPVSIENAQRDHGIADVDG